MVLTLNLYMITWKLESSSIALGFTWFNVFLLGNLSFSTSYIAISQTPSGSGSQDGSVHFDSALFLVHWLLHS